MGDCKGQTYIPQKIAKVISRLLIWYHHISTFHNCSVWQALLLGPRVKIEVGIPLTIDVIDVSNLMSLYPKGLLVHTVQCSAVADLSESLSCLTSLVRHVLQVVQFLVPYH